MEQPKLILITGGTRSGKSRMALRLATPPKTFLATAEPVDDEMRERIQQHRMERGADWTTVEEPQTIADVASRIREGSLVIDCLTLWIYNLLMAGMSDVEIEEAAVQLKQVLLKRNGKTIIVTNEVGMGIVPDNALARRFRDLAGRVNQTIASAADELILMVCGIPLRVIANA